MEILGAGGIKPCPAKHQLFLCVCGPWTGCPASCQPGTALGEEPKGGLFTSVKGNKGTLYKSSCQANAPIFPKVTLRYKQKGLEDLGSACVA